MFHKTIDSLKATEAAIAEELEALWVPFDPETGNGGLHWHAAGSSILQNALRGVTGLREELEKRQAPIDTAQAEADAAEQATAAAEPALEPEPVVESEAPVEEEVGQGA